MIQEMNSLSNLLLHKSQPASHMLRLEVSYHLSFVDRYCDLVAVRVGMKSTELTHVQPSDAPNTSAMIGKEKEWLDSWLRYLP